MFRAIIRALAGSNSNPSTPSNPSTKRIVRKWTVPADIAETVDFDDPRCVKWLYENEDCSYEYVEVDEVDE